MNLKNIQKCTSLLNHSLHIFSSTSNTMIRKLTSYSLPPNSTNSKFAISNSNLKQALLEMAFQGTEMKFEGYDLLLNECVSQKGLIEGQRVQAHMIKTQYLPPVYLRNRLIVFYTKCECLEDARMVFDEIPERNVVSWTAMISGYSRRGYASEALVLFVEMLKSGVSGLLHGRQIHSHIIKLSFDAHVYVGSSLLDLYAKTGWIHEARVVFDGLPERDVVSCTAIISGYAQLGFDEEALKLFCQLQEEGMISNYVTYASVLTAISGLAAYEHGRQVHSHVLRFQLPSYAVLQNSLIDMYSKCGNLTYSRRIFDNMSERTVITWNTMLVGYSKHGRGQDAVKVFELMREENKVLPDKVTFLALLSACSHGGMENRGLEFFDEMVRGKTGVEPDIGHYGTVVDLLGRAGQIEKAFKFVKDMPFEPTGAIWGSLLGACSVHQNVDIGQYVGSQLLIIEPENAGNYVVLSNLLASAGRWNEVRVVRDMMMEKAITKEPGKSWIELDKTIHTFHADDRSHPQKEEVAEKVREMSVKVREAGYVPNLSCVLYDVDEEQKGKMLLGHSEKLALAFALMCTPQKRPIRVMKNLRICVDCHNFAKFVSKIYEREIYLRDKSRYHHIVDGVCSCGNYW
ncbi:putative pentatricopeptide repeat-containing protein At3g13770, mitochondrial isoform X2 [Daucus carota subsp. sativus]|uniref:putative pentatricopeptide repeat-containing protein At3g13770, mitochondrial isoform X2 n=1 Tax=Daucus carota subsp. sativus TaxID=79200 RepID=UPI0030830CEE